MITDKKLQKLINLIHVEGLENAQKLWGASEKSMQRYRALAVERGIEPTTTWGKAPKVLVFDIETLPMEVYSWRIGYNLSINHNNIIKEWSVLSWSANWLMEPEVMFDCVTPQEAIDREDGRVCQSLWELFDEADVLIGHNGRNFDVRKMNARFIYHEMIPPSPYEVIDTYKEITRIAAFTSHKQDYLTKFLGLEEKLETNFDLWHRCAIGQQEALDEMLTYNKQDVNGLQELYLTLRPWMTRHPSLNLYYPDTDGKRCQRCTSTDIELTTDFYTTPSGRYRTYRCNHCGGQGRTGKNQIKKPSGRLRTPAR